MITGFTDNNGKFRPTGFVPVIHPSIKNSFNQNEPKDSKSQRAKGIAKLLGSKTVALGKKAHEKKIEHDKEIKVKRQTVRFQINDVLESDAPAKIKFYRIQELMIRNKKVLQKEDFNIYNKRLAEIHQEMVNPPVKQVEYETYGYRENDPFEELGKPTPDEIALNRLHEKMMQQNEDNESDDKLDIYAKASAIH